jgi:hypothetical protein
MELEMVKEKSRGPMRGTRAYMSYLSLVPDEREGEKKRERGRKRERERERERERDREIFAAVTLQFSVMRTLLLEPLQKVK